MQPEHPGYNPPPAAVPPPSPAPEPTLHLVVQASVPAPPPPQLAAAPAPVPAAAPAPGKKSTAEQLREALKEVYDPEIPINIVDLGLLYKIEEHDGIVDIDMTLTSPHCPIGDLITEQVRETIRTAPGITAVNVRLVFEPLWTKEMITADGRLQASMLGLM